jgi:hypothetical protein
MNRVLKNLLMLALTLFVSTAAATLLRELMRAARWTMEVNSVRLAPPGPPTPRMPDAPLLITYQPRPARTAQAIRDDVKGVVKLDMLLLADGTIGDIRPREVLPDGLTERALEAAAEIRFRPAVMGGQFTNTWQTVEFKFDSANDLQAAKKE